MWQSLGWNPLSPRLFLPRLGRFAAPDYPSRRAFRCESRAAGEMHIYARTRPLRGIRLRVRSPGLLRQIARICHSGRIRLSPEAARSRSRSPCVRSRRLHPRFSPRYFLAGYRFVVSRRSRGESAEPRSPGSLSSTHAATDPSLTSKRNSPHPLRRLCALEKNCREDVSQDARVELSGWQPVRFCGPRRSDASETTKRYPARTYRAADGRADAGRTGCHPRERDRTFAADIRMRPEMPCAREFGAVAERTEPKRGDLRRTRGRA